MVCYHQNMYLKIVKKIDYVDNIINRKNDLYKMKCANENGFSVIRILQKDVYHNNYDWLTELIDNIEKNTNENRVQNIYMCKKNEYKDFDF